MPDSEWLTQREAAEILGVHLSAVPKMIARGDLRPREGQRPSLARHQVLELASARRRRQERLQKSTGPQPPDWEHDWVLASAAAKHLGCSASALNERARIGTAPSVVHKRRRWFRVDLLEMQARAHAARAAEPNRSQTGPAGRS